MAPPKGRRGKLTMNSKPQQCLFCLKTYRHYQILESHTNLHTGENPYECQICDATFPYFSNLGRHKDLVHLKKRYNCSICSASYAGNQDLRGHMDRVHYGKKYICGGCRTQYSSHVTLKRHRDGGFCKGVKKLLHSIKMRNLQNKSDKVMKKVLVKNVKPKKTQKLIKSTNETGSGGRGRRKKFETTLKKEINVEPPKRSGVIRKPILKTADVKNVTKLQTKPAAKKKTSFKSSEKVKSSNKPVVHTISTTKTKFKCSTCQTFHLDRNSLLRHFADRHNRKIFECPVCKNLYTDYGNMYRHMKTSHPNFKNYLRDSQCSVCDLRFESYSLLLQHKKEKHNLKLFKCPYCPNEYTDYSNMLRHRKGHEKEGTKSPGISTTATKCATNSCISSLETYPVIGLGVMGKEITADSSENISIRDKVLQLFNNLKNKKKENDESFFLHLNRYDPASV